jgi:hypothetical protein
MFTCIRKFRSLVLTAALGVLFGSTAANAQAPKSAAPNPAQPNAKGHTYVFTLENFEILNTRSRHNDTDHVSFALKVGDKVYPAKVKHMGDVNNGTHKVNLSFGPIEIPTPETKVVLTYLIMNSGHDQDKVAGWLQKGAEQLLEKGETAAGEFGPIVKYLGKLGISVLFADCDGWVAGDHITLTGKTLAGFGDKHKTTREYPGVDSARGCGANSLYKVTWSVALKK